MMDSFAYFLYICDMDVRQYFEPVDFSNFSSDASHLWKFSLGKDIEKSTLATTASNIPNIQIAIFGVPNDNGKNKTSVAQSPEKIRAALYRLSSHELKTKIVDFGNLKASKNQKGTYLALRDIVEFFNELNIITLIIGGSQDLTVGMAESFRNNPFFSLTVIDALLDVKKGREVSDSSNFLSRIFTQNPSLFQFNLLGYQTHLVPQELFSKTIGISQHCRLGILKERFKQAETVLRNSDCVSFDFGAIKNSEVQGHIQKNPNGLLSDEACQLAKYAGFSNRVQSFGIFNTDSGDSVSGIPEKLAAEIIWYFIEGYLNRTEDKFQTTGKTKYKVEISGLDHPIVFYKCETTKRWWFEILTTTHKKIFIACSKKDYRLAASDELPEIWLRFTQKINEILK